MDQAIAPRCGERQVELGDSGAFGQARMGEQQVGQEGGPDRFDGIVGLALDQGGPAARPGACDVS
jgi:hypothetical protein